MVCKKRILLLLFLSAFFLTAFSTHSFAGGVEKFSLDESIAFGLKNSPVLKGGEIRIDQADMDIKSQRGRFLPNATAGYIYSELTSEYRSGYEESDILDQTNKNLSLRISQTLFAGFENKNRFERAKLGKEYETAQLDLQRLDLVYQIKTLFFEILKTKYDISTIDQRIKRLESDLESARALKGGKIQMALTQTQVSQLYVSIFGRASEGEGNTYWQSQNSMVEAAAFMLGSEPAQDYFGETLDDNQAFIQHIYLNTLGKTVADDAGGIAYWVGRLDSGDTKAELIVDLINAALSPENAGAAQDQFKNKVDVSNTAADLIYEFTDMETFTAYIKDVDDSEESVAAAKAAVNADADAGPVEPEEPVEPEVPGDKFFLTANQDIIDGTAGNDTFIADVVQVGGPQVNSLASGDVINAGAGIDTLEAQITTGLFMGGTNMPIQPRLNDVEVVKLEALNNDMYDQVWKPGLNSEVFFNAKNAYGVNEIWSNHSDANLTIQNLTTMTAAGNHDIARNTSEMTVGMAYTGSNNSVWDESDMHVFFDQDFLLTGQQAESQAIYYLLDQDADLFNRDRDGDGVTDLLADINANGLRFTVDNGAVQTIEFDPQLLLDSVVITHADFVAALQPALAQLIADGLVPEDTTLKLNPALTDFTYLDDGSRSSDIPAMVLETKTDAVLKSVGFAWVQDMVGEYNVYGRLDTDAEVSKQPLSVEVALEKVGNGGEGGELIIGSMDKYQIGHGINEFYVTVYGDAAGDHGNGRPSSLSRLDSTGKALDKIYITSDNDGFPGESYADLAIGNGNTGANPYTGDNSPVNDGMDLIQSNGFMGNLSLGTVFNTVDDLVKLNTTDMAGSTDFWATVSLEDNYSYSTGSGDDWISVVLDTDAINTIGTGLAINTGAGDDAVFLDGSGIASQLTMAALGNVNINTGAGDDYVFISNEVRTNINAGSGSDFVEFDGGNSGTWAFGQATGPQLFGDRVLYKAVLNLTFAGFEGRAAIETDSAGNFIANQLTINAAIEDAIASNPELARLLNVTDGNGYQQIFVNSLIGGENDLKIQITQPGQVAANIAGDMNALVQGIIDTTPLDSDALTTPAAVIAAMAGPNFNGAAFNGNIDASGVAGADYQAYNPGTIVLSTNGGVANYSVIDMGAGSNDLLVMDSNLASANVLKVSDTFGKVSVVNFHNVSPNAAAAIADVGNHALDFTTYLNNQIDPSASTNTMSATSINITLNTNAQLAGSPASTGTALANSVNMLNFNGNVVNTVSFGALTADNLVNALNNAPGVGIPVVGGINNATLNAATSTVNLIGNVQNHIVMVENDQNPGEYKVFSLTSTVVSGTTGGKFNTNGAELLGTLDFGNSINFGLVGNADWDAMYAGLLLEADGGVVPPVDPVDPVDPIFTLTADDDSFDEGDTATFTITTENVDVGTEVNYTIGGDVDADDIDGALTGVAVIQPDGTAVIEISLIADEKTEGEETLTVTLDGLDETASVVVNDTSLDPTDPTENVIDVAAGKNYAGTDGVVDVFQYEVDSTTGRVVGLDGEVGITGFLAGEDRLEFVDAGEALTDANFLTFPGVSIAENPFGDIYTNIAFDPSEEGVSSLITLNGIQDVALDTIDFAVV